MRALDTNILARFYVDDPNDPEATKQRPIAREVFTDNEHLFVPLTVILELEWVLRAFYEFTVEDFVHVVNHLLGLANVTVEDWAQVAEALELHQAGLDFADALHLISSRHCNEFLSFDDRRFARRAQRLNTKPPVIVPAP
jgi:predicted nucleic-acid-binding protein